MGFMDCWEEFSVHYVKADFTKVQAKKGYTIQKMLLVIAEKWSEEQVLQFYDEIKSEELKGMISGFLAQKYELDKMLKSLKGTNIDGLR